MGTASGATEIALFGVQTLIFRQWIKVFGSMMLEMGGLLSVATIISGPAPIAQMKETSSCATELAFKVGSGLKSFWSITIADRYGISAALEVEIEEKPDWGLRLNVEACMVTV